MAANPNIWLLRKRELEAPERPNAMVPTGHPDVQWMNARPRKAGLPQRESDPLSRLSRDANIDKALMPPPITVVVIDDHVLFRSGLRELLEQEQINVVGEASSAEAGIELVQHHAPNVAIMDLNLPRMSGQEAIRRIGEVAPETQVLVLSISTDEADVTEAVLAGACGYLLKDASVGA